MSIAIQIQFSKVLAGDGRQRNTLLKLEFIDTQRSVVVRVDCGRPRGDQIGMRHEQILA